MSRTITSPLQLDPEIETPRALRPGLVLLSQLQLPVKLLLLGALFILATGLLVLGLGATIPTP